MNFDMFSDKAFAAYLAGFTDGEGHIAIPQSHGGFSGVRITLANCVPDVLRGIQQRLDYGSIRSQQQKENWRERFVWVASNIRDCEHFLHLVYPYLQIKRQDADNVLARIAAINERRTSVDARNYAIVEAARSGERRKDIAARFGISPQLVSRLCEGHNWPSEISRIAKSRKRDPQGRFTDLARLQELLQSENQSND